VIGGPGFCCLSALRAQRPGRRDNAPVRKYIARRLSAPVYVSAHTGAEPRKYPVETIFAMP
jgi:hypothetical protein